MSFLQIREKGGAYNKKYALSFFVRKKMWALLI